MECPNESMYSQSQGDEIFFRCSYSLSIVNLSQEDTKRLSEQEETTQPA